MNNEREKQVSDVTEERLDRLVDGELSRDEYRALLESLDREPDGWRRCALAFLEAQAWQRELPIVRAEGFVGAASGAPSTTAHRNGGGSVWSTWAGRLALAASWFLVFALGASSYQTFFATDRPDSMFASPDARSGAQPGRHANVAAKGNPPATANLAGGDVPGGNMTGGSVAGGATPAMASGLEFQIADRQGNVLNRYVMPVSDSGTAVESYDAASQPAVPDELADAARAAKYDVRTNRTWIPVQVQNGGNVLLPLDHIELQPRRARLPY